MSDLLGIGASGITAYRTALATVGDNVANSETEGYSRRTTSLRQSSATAATSPLYRGGNAGGGVEVAGINRVWDEYRAIEARVSASDHGRADARMRWLSGAETALDDGDTGAGARITAFYNAADALAGDPGNPMARSAMLAALDGAAGSLRTTADGLARVSEGIAAEASSDVASISANLAALANVNLAITRSGANTPSRASLLDQRDQLVDGISQRIAIDVRYDAQGKASISLTGNSAQPLLDGASAAALSTQVAADGRISLLVTFDGETRPIAPTGGSLAGLVDSANAVAGRRAQIEAIAIDFAATINGWQANGRTESGTAGGPLLALDGGAASIRLATDDPAAIAAASSNGVANGNLLALQGLRAGGAETRLANLVASHSQAVAAAKAESAATSARRDSAFASLDEVSGVDLDREAADLLRYQQAYDASSKIVQVARETLQEIFNLF